MLQLCAFDESTQVMTHAYGILMHQDVSNMLTFNITGLKIYPDFFDREGRLQGHFVLHRAECVPSDQADALAP